MEHKGSAHVVAALPVGMQVGGPERHRGLSTLWEAALLGEGAGMKAN